MALAAADVALIAPIYAAREAHDPSVSHVILAETAQALGGNVSALDSFDDIRTALLQEGENSLIITMGAGDIYKVAQELTEE